MIRTAVLGFVGVTAARTPVNQGDAYPGLEELAPQLQPEKLLAQSDTFIQEKVIPYTDYHIAADEAKTLKRCAARSLDNQM